MRDPQRSLADQLPPPRYQQPQFPALPLGKVVLVEVVLRDLDAGHGARVHQHVLRTPRQRLATIAPVAGLIAPRVMLPFFTW